MINEEKMDNIMLELGFTEGLSGAKAVRAGIRAYDQGHQLMTKELYPTIAAQMGSTPARIERRMRHSIERAWERGSYNAQLKWFGYTIDPRKGKPTVGEFVAQMARICHED